MKKNKVNNIKKNWLSTIKVIISKCLTKHNQIFLYIITIVMIMLTILDIIKKIFPLPVSITIYACAAICFFPSCILWIRSLHSLVTVVLLPFTKRNTMIHKFIKDYRLRTVIMTLPSLSINLIFAVSNAVVGVTSQSKWYGSLAAYYIILCIIRFISIMYAKSLYIDKIELTTQQKELKVYKNCGKMLFIMSITLMGAVTILVTGDGGQSYQGVIIYAVAAYTFYKLAMSIWGMIKARKVNSLLSITLRNIGHSEALVALLSLQTALFAAFGQKAKDMIPVMNGITGAIVCLTIMALGIYMVYDARKRICILHTSIKEGLK